MTAAASSQALSRFYDTPARPFRLNRKTVFAISVAAAFHGLVGYLVVTGQFEAMKAMDYDEGPVITFDNWKPEPLPPPPPKPFVEQQVKPQSFETHVPPVLQDIPSPPPFYADHVETEAPAGPIAALPDPTPVPAAPVAPSIPKPDPIIRNPTWLKKPTPEQIGNLYPTRAIDRGVGGGATLLCEVAVSGSVGNCAVVDESPKGYRFGDAALAMTRYFRMNPRTVDGAIQAGSKVRIPIVFNPG